MAKEKTPFFSMGARGTVGNMLTAQKLGRQTLIRTKPTPTDPYTLKQAYHRWDYQDAIAWWNRFSPLEKRAYAVEGSKRNQTALSVWIKEYLSGLPYLWGRWHLDERGGAVAFDSTPASNSADVFGATSHAGFIDYARFFDGLNDFLMLPFGVISDMTLSSFSIEADFLITKNSSFIQRGDGVPLNQVHLRADSISRFGVWLNGVGGEVSIPLDCRDGLRHHITGVRDFSNNTIHIYVDDLSNSAVNATPSLSLEPTSRWRFGRCFIIHAVWWLGGLLDNVTFYKYALTQADHLRHAERSYPAL